MRRNKEIIILLVLLLGTMAFVLWYVIDRRAAQRAAPPAPTPAHSVGPLAPTPPRTAAPVDLTQHDGQTIDYSSGQPVVKNSAEDQAAIAAAKRDIDEALKDVTFTAPKPSAK